MVTPFFDIGAVAIKVYDAVVLDEELLPARRQEGAVLLDLKKLTLRYPAIPLVVPLIYRVIESCFVFAFAGAFFLLLCVPLALAQKASPDITLLPKYDLHTETKTKGIVDEVNLLPLGIKKDLAELVIKSGDDKIHIYLCPKTFEEEMGITFLKGDEIAITGSKVKQEAADVILVRELVRGNDTLVFRDDKGNPVWNPRTGK